MCGAIEQQFFCGIDRRYAYNQLFPVDQLHVELLVSMKQWLYRRVIPPELRATRTLPVGRWGRVTEGLPTNHPNLTVWSFQNGGSSSQSPDFRSSSARARRGWVDGW
jgi:hypothetical protein